MASCLENENSNSSEIIKDSCSNEDSEQTSDEQSILEVSQEDEYSSKEESNSSETSSSSMHKQSPHRKNMQIPSENESNNLNLKILNYILKPKKSKKLENYMNQNEKWLEKSSSDIDSSDSWHAGEKTICNRKRLTRKRSKSNLKANKKSYSSDETSSSSKNGNSSSGLEISRFEDQNRTKSKKRLHLRKKKTYFGNDSDLDLYVSDNKKSYSDEEDNLNDVENSSNRMNDKLSPHKKVSDSDLENQNNHSDISEYMKLQSLNCSSVDNHQKKVYICYKCGDRFKRIDHYENHLLTHLAIKPFSCLFCNFETVYKVSLKNHEGLHPEYKKTLTKWDTFINSTNSTFNEQTVFISPHTNKSAIKIKLFKCSLCIFKTNYKQNLLLHYKKKHQKYYFKYTGKMVKNKNNIKFTCSFCPLVTTSFGSLRTHISQRHPLGKKNNKQFSTIYKCDICLFETTSKNGLKVHIGIKHARLKIAHRSHLKRTPKTLTLEPRIVDKYFENNLIDSTNGEDGEQPNVKAFPCSKCPYVTVSSFGLKIHLLKHKNYNKMPSKVFCCKLCPYKALNTASLRSHNAAWHKNKAV